MGDAYWSYGDVRHQAAVASMAAPQPTVKRPRPDCSDVSGGHELVGYYSHDEERSGQHALRDSESLGASYDRYLRNGLSSYGSGEPIRDLTGAMLANPVEDFHTLSASGLDSRIVGYGTGRIESPLPPDSSNTLYVEGLPANCTRREASHIFRPFVGFEEVRIVNKESRHPAGDPLVLCFVDFHSAAQAAVALEALQDSAGYGVLSAKSYKFGNDAQSRVHVVTFVPKRGYKFDENDRESTNLRLQFARFPGPRSSGGFRGRR